MPLKDLPFALWLLALSFMQNKCAKQWRPQHHSLVQQEDCGKGHTTDIRLYGLNYNNFKPIVSVTFLVKRSFSLSFAICYWRKLYLLVSDQSRSSRAIEPLKVKVIGQWQLPLYLLNHCSKQGEGHPPSIQSHTPSQSCSFSTVSVTSVNHLKFSAQDQYTLPIINLSSLLGCCQLVSAFCNFKGGHSTVLPKSVPSDLLEPFKLPLASFVLSEPAHPHKEKYFLLGPVHPLKVKYSLSAVQISEGARWQPIYQLRCFPTWTGVLRTSSLPGPSTRRDWSITLWLPTLPKKTRWYTHILFFGGKASERWTTLKDQLSEENQMDADEVFKAFANSFEKSSSHWQAKDEYLSDTKQGKWQTTAELDIYIKDLARMYQFQQAEQELHKIELLYHVTAHFEVRKFVHNAKPKKLTYDKMIEVTKAHERTCHEYQMHKQAYSMASPVNTPNLCFKQVLCWSLFRKALPRSPVANVDTHNHSECPSFRTTCSGCGKNHWVQQCRSSGRRHSSLGCTPSPRRPQQQGQRRQSGNKFNKGRGHGGGGSQFNKKTTPKKGAGCGRPHKINSLTVPHNLSGPPHPPKVDGPGKEFVSINADLSGPAHPPKLQVSIQTILSCVMPCDAMVMRSSVLM